MRAQLVFALVCLTARSVLAVAMLHEQPLEYVADGVKMKGLLVYDEHQEGKRPGVLVVHEWWGNNDYSRQRARMFAELGYVALAVDMYGDGKLANNPTEARELAGSVMSNPDVAVARLRAALNALQEQASVDPQRVVAVGYCFGGGVVLHGARAGLPLLAVGSFHGSLATTKPAQKGAVNTKVFVANGAADASVSPAQITAFEAEMHAADVDYKLNSYADAKHAFTNPKATELGKRFGMPIAYNAAADKKSWQDWLAFVGPIVGSSAR